MIGAVDGKQNVLEQPNKSGSHYRNYKGTDSILLMAVVGDILVIFLMSVPEMTLFH